MTTGERTWTRGVDRHGGMLTAGGRQARDAATDRLGFDMRRGGCFNGAAGAQMQRRMKVLLVSYWYPPAVGAAAERIASFAKYLPDFGVDVCVLTAEREEDDIVDGGARVIGVADQLGASAATFGEYGGRRETGRISRWVRDIVFPDRFGHWAAGAARRGERLVREEQFDAILATFPPASVVSAALAIHRKTAIPMILDFRDRWLGPGGYEPTSARAAERHQSLEREAIRAASGITAVSEAMADAIAAEHGLPRGRVGVVMNGFDPCAEGEEGRGAMDSRRVHAAGNDGEDQRLVIAHVGTVIERNRPDLFFESVRRIHGRRGGVRFVFVGNLSREYVQRLGVSDVVETTGMVSRRDAGQWMQSADALLLLSGAYVGQWGYSAKLFEYLRTGRPIICLEEAGSNDRRLLEELAADRCCFARLGDDDGLLRALEQVERLVAGGARGGVPAGLDAFHRRSQAERLARHIRGVLSNL
ncbi:hypothetical protein B7486_19975 [cyanobacterium TDX16]|nr:hypothetical protein B7486_19975 [cyanobacterium TDX16]